MEDGEKAGELVNNENQLDHQQLYFLLKYYYLPKSAEKPCLYSVRSGVLMFGVTFVSDLDYKIQDLH